MSAASRSAPARGDVIVVGAGLAGLTAALRAIELGLRVILVGRGGGEPSTSSLSSGNLHFAHRSARRPAADLAQRTRAILGADLDPSVVAALAENAERALDWLLAHEVRVQERGGGEWQASVVAASEGAPAGRPLVPVLERLRQRVSEHAVVATSAVVHDVERADDGTWRVLGTAAGGGRSWQARALVLADGGFQGNRALVSRHLRLDPDTVVLRGGRTGDGLALRVAEKLGASLSPLDRFIGCLVSGDALANERLTHYPSMDQLAIASIVVDATGQRFADEGRGANYVSNYVARLPGGVAWVVCDDAIWTQRGASGNLAPNPTLLDRGGTVHRAETIEAVADLAGLPRQATAETVRGYNEALAAGRELALPVARTTPPALIRDARFYSEPLPILRAPYCAIPVRAGITTTSGGPLIDARSRMLSGGAPIPGLYAVGATAGSIETSRPGGYVSGLLRSVVTSLLAVEDIARLEGRLP